METLQTIEEVHEEDQVFEQEFDDREQSGSQALQEPELVVEEAASEVSPDPEPEPEPKTRPLQANEFQPRQSLSYQEFKERYKEIKAKNDERISRYARAVIEIENKMKYNDKEQYERKERLNKKKENLEQIENWAQKELESVEEQSFTKKHQMYLVWYQASLPLLEKIRSILNNLKTAYMLKIMGSTGCGKSTLLPQILWVEREQYFPDLEKVIVVECGTFEATNLYYQTSKVMREGGFSEVSMCLSHKDMFEPTKRGIFYTNFYIFIEALIKNRKYFIDSKLVVILDDFHIRKMGQDAVFSFMKYYVDENKEKLTHKFIVNLPIDESAEIQECTQNIVGIRIPEIVEEVEIRYQPFNKYLELGPQLVDLLGLIERKEREREGDPQREKGWEFGHVLIFFPGVGELNRSLAHFKNYIKNNGIKNLVLFNVTSKFCIRELLQQLNGSKRVIIFVCSLLQSNITIPNLRYVVDFGRIEQKKFNIKTDCFAVKTVSISQQLGSQRCGRIGRIGSGVCFRYYDENDFKNYRKDEVAEFHVSVIDRHYLALVLLFEVFHEKIDFYKSELDKDRFKFQFEKYQKYFIFKPTQDEQSILKKKIDAMELFIQKNSVDDRHIDYILSFNLNQILLIQSSMELSLTQLVITLIVIGDIYHSFFKKSNQHLTHKGINNFYRSFPTAIGDNGSILKYLNNFKEKSDRTDPNSYELFSLDKEKVTHFFRTMDIINKKFGFPRMREVICELPPRDEEKVVQIYAKVYKNSLSVAIPGTDKMYCIKKRCLVVPSKLSFFGSKQRRTDSKYWIFTRMEKMGHIYFVKNIVELTKEQLELLLDKDLIEQALDLQNMKISRVSWKISLNECLCLEKVIKQLRAMMKKDSAGVIEELNRNEFVVIFFREDLSLCKEYGHIVDLIDFIRYNLINNKISSLWFRAGKFAVFREGYVLTDFFDSQKGEFHSILIRQLKFRHLRNIVEHLQSSENCYVEYPENINDYLMDKRGIMNQSEKRDVRVFFENRESALRTLHQMNSKFVDFDTESEWTCASSSGHFIGHSYKLSFYRSEAEGKAFLKPFDAKSANMKHVEQLLKSDAGFKTCSFHTSSSGIEIRQTGPKMTKELIKSILKDKAKDFNIIVRQNEEPKQEDLDDILKKLMRIIIKKTNNKPIYKMLVNSRFDYVKVYVQFAEDVDESILGLNFTDFSKRTLSVERYNKIFRQVHDDQYNRILEELTGLMGRCDIHERERQKTSKHILKLVTGGSEKDVLKFLALTDGVEVPIPPSIRRIDVRKLVATTGMFKRKKDEIVVFDNEEWSRSREYELEMEKEVDRRKNKKRFSIKEEFYFDLVKDDQKFWNQVKERFSKEGADVEFNESTLFITSTAADPELFYRQIVDLHAKEFAEGATQASSDLHCELCLQNYFFLVCFTICGHRFCQNCLSSIAHVALVDGMQCFICGHFLAIDDVNQFIKSSELRKLVDRVEGDQNISKAYSCKNNVKLEKIKKIPTVTVHGEGNQRVRPHPKEEPKPEQPLGEVWGAVDPSDFRFDESDFNVFNQSGKEAVPEKGPEEPSATKQLATEVPAATDPSEFKFDKKEFELLGVVPQVTNEPQFEKSGQAARKQAQPFPNEWSCNYCTYENSAGIYFCENCERFSCLSCKEVWETEDGLFDHTCE